jgi:hypothetical protein
MLSLNSKRALGIIALVLLVTPPLLEEANGELLNRSIYIPVHFRLCQHMKKGVLYIGDQAVAHLPAERIFQFTYYPSLERVAPETVPIRIEAIDIDDNPIVARMAVGPDGITTAHEHVEFDLSKQLKKLSYKIDVHYQKVRLLVRCGHWCGNTAQSETDRADQRGEGGSSEEPIGEVEKHPETELKGSK